MKNNTEIEEELKAAGANTLLEIDRTQCFAIPDGYFDRFSDELIGNIRLSDTGYTSPVLSKIGTRPPFEVPRNYFEGLAETITQNAMNHTPAKVIPMRNSRIRKFRTYLMAAAVSVSAIIGLYVWQSTSFNNIPDASTSLSGVSDESLNRYLQETDYVTDLSETPDVLFLTQSFAAEEPSLEGLLHEIPEEDLIYYTNDFL